MSDGEQNEQQKPDQRVGFFELSKREREIVLLIAKGHSTFQIAEILGLSAKTIESHRTHINYKLDVHSSLELVRKVLLDGSLTLQDLR